MKNKKIYLLSSLLLLLASCNSGDSTINLDSVSSEDSTSIVSTITNEDKKTSDVYEAVQKLINYTDYTLTTSFDDGYDTTEYDNIYTQSYTWCNYPYAEVGYIEDSNGVYRVDKYNNKIISSELYEDAKSADYKSLWESKTFVSFHDLSIDTFEDAKGKTQFEVTNKKDKLTMLRLYEIDDSYYTAIKSLKFYLLGDNINTLNITMTFNNNAVFDSTVNSFGESKAAEVINFLAENKTYTTLDDDLVEVKRLFKLDNYKRLCYREEDPSKDIIGYEWFTENYFYGDYLKQFEIFSEYGYTEAGYLGLNKKVKDGKKYDGGYLFYLDDDYNMTNFYDYAPAFTSNISSMSKIMNYPSNMVMFDYNLQFFEKVETDLYPGKNVFSTTDTYIINDWIDNFQISLSLSDGQEASIYDLRIITDLYTETPEASDVIFQFDYVIDGVVYGLQREFTDFGNSNIKAVDDFYATFEDQ